MIHTLRRQPAEVRESDGQVTYSTQNRGYLTKLAIASAAFALVSYFEAVPHAVGKGLAAGALIIASIAIIIAGLSCSVTFDRYERTMSIEWRLYSCSLSQLKPRFDDVVLHIRHYAGISGSEGGAMDGASGLESCELWLAVKFGGQDYLLEYVKSTDPVGPTLQRYRQEFGFDA
ncbi:hypothetical protein GALL_138480 [mine drainage metagenome]|uniref:Uncharacterized protein n=1 Tax=mine drainage metagenome TaxID=410659 RepID=A0A1J5SJ01_9ZZZZ